MCIITDWWWLRQQQRNDITGFIDVCVCCEEMFQVADAIEGGECWLCLSVCMLWCSVLQIAIESGDCWVCLCMCVLWHKVLQIARENRASDTLTKQSLLAVCVCLLVVTHSASDSHRKYHWHCLCVCVCEWISHREGRSLALLGSVCVGRVMWS